MALRAMCKYSTLLTKFYNPITKCVVISKCAEFGEQYFPGLKHTWNEPAPNATSPPVVSEYQMLITVTFDLDGDEPEPTCK